MRTQHGRASHIVRKGKITDSEWTAKGIKRERGRAFRRVPRWGNQTFKDFMTMIFPIQNYMVEMLTRYKMVYFLFDRRK